jgi:hypothetical protein
VMGLLSGIVSAVYAVVGLGAVGGIAGGALGAVAGFGAVITTPIFAVVGVFVGGAIVHVIGLVAGGKGSYEQSARVAAYAGAVMPIGALLGFHPLVRMLPGLYGLYLVAVGLIAIHAADRKRTYTVVGILAALLVLLSVMAMFAVRAARQLGSELQTQLGAGSDFQRDTQKLQEEMKRVADELQRRAQQQQPPAPPPQAAPPAEAQPPAPPPAQPEPQK